MAQASIHFEPVKGGSEEHNKRLKFLDYVRFVRFGLQGAQTSSMDKHIVVMCDSFVFS